MQTHTSGMPSILADVRLAYIVQHASGYRVQSTLTPPITTSRVIDCSDGICNSSIDEVSVMAATVSDAAHADSCRHSATVVCVVTSAKDECRVGCQLSASFD